MKYRVYRLRLVTALALLSLYCILSSLYSPPVSAHVLKTEGSIGVVMHIDPGDNPLAGGQSTLFFDVTDKTNKFNAAECACRVDISEGGKVIDSESFSTAIPFIFPQKDVYQINLVGSPETPGQFQPFNLTYNVRVDTDAQNASAQTTGSNPPTTLVAILGGALLIGLAGLVAKKFIRK